MQVPGFIGASYTARSIAIDGQECINFYPVVIAKESPTAKAQIALIGTPGSVPFANIAGNGTIRGLYSSGSDNLYAVCGNGFYQVFPNGTYKLLGTLKGFTGNVYFAELQNNSSNNDILDINIMIIEPNSAGYIYQEGTQTFNPIGDSGYMPGSSITTLSGYFVQAYTDNIQTRGRFAFSTPYYMPQDLTAGVPSDGVTCWPTLNYATAEGSTDPLVAVYRLNMELFLFKSKSVEIWYPTGQQNAPFAPVPNAFMEIGLGARDSVGLISNTLIWLAANSQGNNTIWATMSYTPNRISTHAIEYAMNKMATTSDAKAFCYQEEGHSFYMLTFPTGNRTFCYDLDAGLWHERAYYNPATQKNERYHAETLVQWQGRNYIGSRFSGEIWRLDLDTYTDNGGPIRRIRTGDHIHKDRKRLFFREFEIDIERGIGLQNGQGSDPQAELQWSDDGGFTWNNPVQLSPGKAGNYLARLHLHKLGMSADRVFRLICTDPVKWVLIDARMDVDSEE